jgi:hypothetical protein
MHHHVDEAVLYILLLLTFPAGLAAALLLAGLFAGLYAIARIEVPGGPIVMTATSVFISLTGFVQWFHIVPRIWRRWHDRT